MNAGPIKLWRILSAAVLLASSFASFPASAERPHPLSKDVTLYYGDNGYLEFDAANAGKAECEKVLEWARSPDGAGDADFFRHDLLGELYDRGICVPYDPAEAYRQFDAARQEAGSDWYQLTAWKLWHGDGVAQDRDEAARQFREWAMTFFVALTREEMDAFLEGHFTGRAVPRPVLDDLEWLMAMRKDRRAYMEWAARLFVGRAAFRDGDTLPADKIKSQYIHRFNRSPEDRFIYADTLFREATGEGFGKSSAFDTLFEIATCGYVPAILRLSDILADPEDERYHSPTKAYAWTLVAEKQGAKIDDRSVSLSEGLEPKLAALSREISVAYLDYIEGCD